MKNGLNFKGERSDSVYRLGYSFADAFLNSYFTTIHLDTENLSSVRDEPFIALPFPHTRYLDIPLEGHFIMKNTGREAYFIMAESIGMQGLLKKFGGVSVKRSKDSRVNGKNHSREERAYQRWRLYESIIHSLLSQGEIVVIHPEAAMNVRGFRQGVLSGLVKSQERYGNKINFLPIIINSESGYSLGKTHTLRAGEPFNASTESEIKRQLEEYL